MDSPRRVLPCESLGSVDGLTSEEEENERGANAELFLSDSGSDVEKEVVPLRSWLGPYPHGQSFLYSLRTRWANAGLLCQGPKCPSRTSLGVLTSGWLRPPGPRCHNPAAPDKAHGARLRDADGRSPRKAAGQRRMERGGRKRPSSAGRRSRALERAVQPSAAGIKRHRSKGLGDGEEPGPRARTEGDQLFARKCQELHGFILPLQELLGGLKMGRFDRGLSTFQQSVAMDRIQRIIGVLQKPGMGERYLSTLLQVERMLKVWFPQVALKSSCADCGTASESAAETDMVEESASTETLAPASRPPAGELPRTRLADPASSSAGNAGASPGEPPLPPADWPAVNLTWIHTAPISNPPLSSAFGQALLGPPPPNAYGIILFLHNSPGSWEGHASGTPALPCFQPSRPLPGAGEPLPRCQSLPGTTQGGGGGGLPRRSLACHSKSLPHLPTTSGEKPTRRGDS